MSISGKLNEFIQESNERLNTCKECERYIHSLNVCNYCVCFMPVKVKFPQAECPEGKWFEYKYNKRNNEV